MDDGWKGRLGRDRAAPSGELGGLRSALRAPAVLDHRAGAAGAARRIGHAERRNGMEMGIQEGEVRERSKPYWRFKY